MQQGNILLHLALRSSGSAARGADAVKAAKDRAQAALLIEALAEERPDDLRDAWEDARSRGPKWRERLDRTLSRMPETAGRLGAL